MTESTDTITVTRYIGTDGTPVVQVDTTEGTGRIRVNLNDGPPLYDGDPEIHSVPGFRGPAAPGSILTATAPLGAQQIAEAVIAAGYGDVDTFAFTVDADPIDARTVLALMAKTARAAVAALTPGTVEVRACIDALNAAAEGDSNDAEIEAAHNLANEAGWLADAIAAAAR